MHESCHDLYFFALSDPNPPSPNALLVPDLVAVVHRARVCGGLRAALREFMAAAGWRARPGRFAHGQASIYFHLHFVHGQASIYAVRRPFQKKTYGVCTPSTGD